MASNGELFSDESSRIAVDMLNARAGRAARQNQTRGCQKYQDKVLAANSRQRILPETDLNLPGTCCMLILACILADSNYSTD